MKIFFSLYCLLLSGNALMAQGWKAYLDSARAYEEQKKNDKAIESYLRAGELLKKDSAGSFTYLKVGSSRVDLQACKLEYSIVSPK